MIYKDKYATDFMNIYIKLLNTEAKDTNTGNTGDFTEHFDFSSIRMPTQVIMNLSFCRRPSLLSVPVALPLKLHQEPSSHQSYWGEGAHPATTLHPPPFLRRTPSAD